MDKKKMDSRFRGNDEGRGEAPPWVAAFLAGVMVTGSVRQAVDEAGVSFDTAWALRCAEPEFAMYWDRALRVHKAVAGLSLVDAAAAEEPGVQ